MVDRLIEILKECGSKGIYSDRLASVLEVTELDLRRLLRRARRRCPPGRKIASEQVYMLRGLVRLTRYYLAIDYLTAESRQVELFGQGRREVG